MKKSVLLSLCLGLLISGQRLSGMQQQNPQQNNGQGRKLTEFHISQEEKEELQALKRKAYAIKGKKRAITKTIIGRVNFFNSPAFADVLFVILEFYQGSLHKILTQIGTINKTLHQATQNYRSFRDNRPFVITITNKVIERETLEKFKQFLTINRHDLTLVFKSSWSFKTSLNITDTLFREILATIPEDRKQYLVGIAFNNYSGLGIPLTDQSIELLGKSGFSNLKKVAFCDHEWDQENWNDSMASESADAPQWLAFSATALTNFLKQNKNLEEVYLDCVHNMVTPEALQTLFQNSNTTLKVLTLSFPTFSPDNTTPQNTLPHICNCKELTHLDLYDFQPGRVTTQEVDMMLKNLTKLSWLIIGDIKLGSLIRVLNELPQLTFLYVRDRVDGCLPCTCQPYPPNTPHNHGIFNLGCARCIYDYIEDRERKLNKRSFSIQTDALHPVERNDCALVPFFQSLTNKTYTPKGTGWTI